MNQPPNNPSEFTANRPSASEPTAKLTAARSSPPARQRRVVARYEITRFPLAAVTSRACRRANRSTRHRPTGSFNRDTTNAQTAHTSNTPELSARLEQFWGHWSKTTDPFGSLLPHLVDQACATTP